MTKHPDCAERCQAAEQKGYPACADECAWIERYSNAAPQVSKNQLSNIGSSRRCLDHQGQPEPVVAAPQGSGNPRNSAEILQAEHNESAYVSAMVKRDQLDRYGSCASWETFGGYSSGFITSSRELNPNNLDRLRKPSALERKKR